MVWPPQPPPKKKLRSNQMQLHMLVDYMAKHRRFAYGPDGYRGPFEMKKFVQHWDDLRVILSKHGSKKSVEQWKHTWRDLKKKARDEAKRYMQTNTSVGCEKNNISQLNSQILSIIGNNSPEHLTSTETDKSNLLQVRPTGAHQVDETVIDVQVNNESVQISVANIRVAVIPEGFPSVQFESDGWAVFVPIMFEKLEEASELPEVDVEGIVAGAIHISCKKMSDVRWLQNTFGGLVIDGRKVKIVNVKNLPKPVKMSWQSRNYVITDNIRVLRLMQRAHPILRTTEWKEVETKVENGLVRRIVLMDNISAEYIKSWGYKLHNGMCTDDFSVLDDSDASDSKLDNSDSRLSLRESSVKREVDTPSPIEIWLVPQEP